MTNPDIQLIRDALAYYASGSTPGNRAQDALSALDRILTQETKSASAEFEKHIHSTDANGWTDYEAMSGRDIDIMRRGWMAHAALSKPATQPMTPEQWWQGMDEAVTSLRAAAKQFGESRLQAADEVMESAAKRIDRIRWAAIEAYLKTGSESERQLTGTGTPDNPLCDKDRATLTRWAVQIERLAQLFPDERAQMCRLAESLLMTVIACTKQKAA